MDFCRKDVILRPERDGGFPYSSDSRPFLVEIGFGNGDFLVHLAQKRPDAAVYGIEMSKTCIEKALSRVQLYGVPNVKLLCGDARFLIRELFPDESIERIFMSFPCPWPKLRHARRRVTSKSFSGAIAAVLKIGGIFELATDELWYADEVAQIIGSHPSLRLVERKLNFRRDITTKYERKWLDLGKDIHLLYFQKQNSWTVRRLTEGRAEDMHVRIVPAVAVDRDKLDHAVRGLAGKCGEKESESCWTYRGVYSDPEGILLVETISVDDGFEQKFYLKVVVRDGSTLVKLDGVHLPYLTPSVRCAIQELGARVRSL